VRLHDVAAAIAAGELSPVDHVCDVLGRLEADRLGLVITMDAEDVRWQAEVLAGELAAGYSRGPLHGVTVGVKDMIDVAGLPTRCGSAVLADAPPAAADAAIVAALRQAGAVVVAKLHTHEFAYGPTGDVAATGPAHNPHDPTRITGGSSSGSAAAVAAGYLPLAIGTDTGCSIRTPAALCGVVGLKPALGALPTQGVFPLSDTCDHVGLIAADALSVALAWGVLAPDDRQLGVVPRHPATLGRTQTAIMAGERGDGGRPVVGVATGAYWVPHDPVIAAAVLAAAASLSRVATVVEVDTPDIGELAATYAPIVGSEAYATHTHWLAERPGDYQPATAERMRTFADLPAAEYVAAQRTRRRLATELWEHLRVAGVDVLLTPTTPLRATPIGARKVDVGAAQVSVVPALLSLTQPFNLTGWPAVSVPGVVTDGGLPAGVQLVGVGVGEAELLRLAALVHQPVPGTVTAGPA